MESPNLCGKGESSTSTNGSTDPVAAGVITEEMLQEEKMLEEKAALEAIKMREELKKKQEEELKEKEEKELEEQCYKRLNLLLKHSSIYAKVIADKIERDQKKETKKRLRTGTTNDKGKSGESKHSRKRKLITEEISDEENKQDIQNIDVLMTTDVSAELKNLPENQPSLFSGGTMYPYQIEGFEWIKVLFENGVNGILADEMGLGKTIQTIAFIAYLIEAGISGPFFICGPLSTLPNWYAEFKRFAPKLPVFLYHGVKENRASIRSKIMRKVKDGNFSYYPVILTSYQIALIDCKFLQKYKWATLVIDEGHRIKNFECKLVSALKSFNTLHRLLLTGTPLQNDLKELWSLLNFLLPDIFDDLKVFESWFDITRLTEKGADEEIIAKEEEKQIVSIIHQILAPFLLRRTKLEVNLQLPRKKEVIVHAPMTELQREYYTAVLNKSIEDLVNPKPKYFDVVVDLESGRPKRKKNDDFTKIYEALKSTAFEVEDEGDIQEISSALTGPVTPKIDDIISDVYLNVRNTTMILRKVINHPYLISYPLDETMNHKVDEDLIRNSGKLLVLDQMLPELLKGKHKVLIFSQFVTMLHILEEYCMYRNYQYSFLDGSMSLTERDVQIKRFNESKDTFIFLLSTKAGGLGLNLATADTCIIYDSDWNPQNDIQAQDRCHRIGQTRPVVIYRLIIPDTVDERIHARATAKRKLEKVIMKTGRFNSSNAKTNPDKLSAKELLELLQMSEYKMNGFVKTDDNSFLSPEELQKILDRSDLEESVQCN